MIVANGDTTHLIPFLALDAVGEPVTGLSSFTVYRSRAGGTPVAMTTPTVGEVDAVNMPGVYNLLLDEDTTIAVASPIAEEMVLIISAAGMRTVFQTVTLQRYATIDSNNRIAVSDVAGNVGGNVVGSVASVTGGINTAAGTITTLDGLDTAQDTQHSTTQSAVNSLSGSVQTRQSTPDYKTYLSNRSDRRFVASPPVRLRAGTVDMTVGIDVAPFFGEHKQVLNVGTPVVSGGSITCTELGPRDEPDSGHQWAVVQLGGTATYQEELTVDVPVDIEGGASEWLRLIIEVPWVGPAS